MTITGGPNLFGPKSSKSSLKKKASFNALSIISNRPFVAKLLTFEVVVILAKFNKIREI